MNRLISRFVRDESGTPAIEYGVIAALVSVVVVTTLGTIGSNLNIKFNSVAHALH